MSLVAASLYLIPLADTITLLSSHPAWTAAACWPFNFEPISFEMQFGISGVILVSHPPFLLGEHKDWAGKRIAGVSMGLAAVLHNCGGSARHTDWEERASVYPYNVVSTLCILLIFASHAGRVPIKNELSARASGHIVAGSSFCVASCEPDSG